MRRFSTFRNSNFKYIDVWPVNFFQPTDQDPFDTTSLFMLQLACIINMVPVWKNLHLRVFHCEISENTSVGESSNSIDAPSKISNEHKLKKLLNMLRISASITRIPNWGEQVGGLKGRALVSSKQDAEASLFESSDSAEVVPSNVSRAYILKWVLKFLS